MTSMNILLFAGSLRKDSLNKKLLNIAKSFIENDHNTQVLDLQTLQLPVYDGDYEKEHGLTGSIRTLIDAVAKADAIIISTPEYNGSISSPLKNTLDWISRERPKHPLAKKPILLIGASPGNFSAIRGLTHSSVPIMNLGAFLYPNFFGLGKADTAFDENGNLIDENNNERLEKLVEDFVLFSLKLSKS